jgi:peptide/nickel transport system ATP-binding protein
VSKNDVLLSIRDLKTHFASSKGPIRAVDGVSFDVRRGETFALLGESGCGKSMTALSIMQLLPSQAAGNVSGKVLLEGRDLLALPEMAMQDVRGRRVAMIFQEPMTSLNPVLTVGEQIGEVLGRHRDLRGTAARSRVLELLDAVGIPDRMRRYGEYPHQLSGGMKQRVMIAIALAGEPQLLIADEPTTALDVTIQAQILDLLRNLQRDMGMAILLITHDLGVVAGMADHVAVMYAGHIVEQAPRESFFAKPLHPYSQKLFASVPARVKRGQPLAVIQGSVPSLAQEFIACRFVDRCDYAWQTCRDIAPRWQEVEPGHGARCHRLDPEIQEPPRTKAPSLAVRHAANESLEAGKGLLEVNRLMVHFPIHKGLFKRVAGHVKAVDGVSLELRRGRTVALVGESGCGKTTVGKSLLQLIRPSAGSVLYNGIELTKLSTRELRRHRRDLQIIFQDPYSSMNPRMMVGDIIEEGMLAQNIGATTAERLQRIDALLTQVGLSAEAKHRYPHEFSGGQRQRICIARALAVDPKIIVCDEPTSALDVSVQAQILNLLKGLQDELGLAYLFITHNMSVVEYLAHSVAVMYLGRIVEQGSVEDVLTSPKHPYTQALLSAIPTLDETAHREVIRLQGDLPSPVNPPQGCHFHPRCPRAMEICRRQYPRYTKLSDTHRTNCFLYGEGNDR